MIITAFPGLAMIHEIHFDPFESVLG